MTTTPIPLYSTLNTALTNFSEITENYEDMTFTALYSIYSVLLNDFTNTKGISPQSIKFLDDNSAIFNENIDYNYSPLVVKLDTSDNSKIRVNVFNDSTILGIPYTKFNDIDEVDNKFNGSSVAFAPIDSAAYTSATITNIVDIANRLAKRCKICVLIHSLRAILIESHSKKNTLSTIDDLSKLSSYYTGFLKSIVSEFGNHYNYSNNDDDDFYATVKDMQNLLEIIKTTYENITRFVPPVAPSPASPLLKDNRIIHSKINMLTNSTTKKFIEFTISEKNDATDKVVYNYIRYSAAKINKLSYDNNPASIFPNDETAIRSDFSAFIDQNGYQYIYSAMTMSTDTNIVSDAEAYAGVVEFVRFCLNDIIYDYLNALFKINDPEKLPKTKYLSMEIVDAVSSKKYKFYDIFLLNISQIIVEFVRMDTNIRKLCLRAANLLNINKVPCYTESDTIRAALDFVYFQSIESGTEKELIQFDSSQLKYGKDQKIYVNRSKNIDIKQNNHFPLLNIDKILNDKFSANVIVGFGKPNNSNLCEMISALSKKYENRLPHNKNILEMYCSHLVAFSIDEGKCSSVSDVRKYLTDILNSKDISNQINEYLNELVNNLNTLKRQSTDYQFNYSDGDEDNY